MLTYCSKLIILGFGGLVLEDRRAGNAHILQQIDHFHVFGDRFWRFSNLLSHLFNLYQLYQLNSKTKYNIFLLILKLVQLVQIKKMT